MKKIVFMFFLLGIISVLPVNAQTGTGDEVTLVVSSDAATKDEAVKLALRSAIEQAFGAFVSANTTILNDELVKDEIVTISTGNIKSFEEIASATLPNGNTVVTLKATVSISKLQSYAKSKGSQAEFAGAAFGMDVKICELNIKNELAALYNLTEQVKLMLPTELKRDLIIKNPRIEPANVLARLENSADDDFSKNYVNRLKESYIMEFRVDISASRSFADYIMSTLNSIAPSSEELKKLSEYGFSGGFLTFNPYGLQGRPKYSDLVGRINFVSRQFRSSYEDLRKWIFEFSKMFLAECLNFKIVDNLGVESYFNTEGYVGICFSDDNDYRDNFAWPCFKLYNKYFNVPRQAIWDLFSEDAYDGVGLFSPLVFFDAGIIRLREQSYGFNFHIALDSHYTLSFIIPKNEIQKYTNFRLERRY